MESQHAMDSKLWIQASSRCYIYKVLKCSWFFIVGYWIIFKIEFEESQYSYGF